MAVLSARDLSDSETQQIHSVSLRVLAEVGVDVCHETIRARLLAAGAAEGATNTRVRFPAGMVAEALACCPAEIALGSVRGDIYRLAPGNRLHSSCVIDPFITMVENLHARGEQILARHPTIVPASRVEDLRRYVEDNR
jgi:trimethylamine:corrinoid methyltransferase-like protein